MCTKTVIIENGSEIQKGVHKIWIVTLPIFCILLFIVNCSTRKELSPPPGAEKICVRFDDVGATEPRFETMSKSDWFEFRESCDTSYAKTDCQKEKLWGPTFGTYCRECDE